jgi:putative transposase
MRKSKFTPEQILQALRQAGPERLPGRRAARVPSARRAPRDDPLRVGETRRRPGAPPAARAREGPAELRREALARHAAPRRTADQSQETHRLYVEESLQLKPRRRRRRSATVREVRAVVTRPHERWAMDFMHDVLATGRPVRVFTLVDVYTRECVALEVARSFSGSDVARILMDAGERCGGLPPIVQCDNGTEFTSTALDHWAYWNHVKLDFSRPGKPVDNSVCEAFNGSLRRECLTRHWFASLAEAQVVLSSWREDYNNHRPHTSLGLRPPAVFRGAGDYLPRFRTVSK